MTGKIFKDSSNVVQDQAKILFNYYQQMAEKIVNEEERIEGEVRKLKAEKTNLEISLDSWLKRLVLWFKSSLKKTRTELQSVIDRIAEFNKMHNDIYKDYKVTKLGVAYVPVAEQIKYENKSFIVDYTGALKDTEIKLQLSKQNDLLISTIVDLEKLSAQAPIIEGSDDIEEMDTEQYSLSMQQLNQHDYFGKLERSLRTISFCMDDLDITSVSLPLVANESNYFEFLKEFATNEVPSNSPIIEVFDAERFQEDISKFQQLNKLKDSLSRDTAKFEDVLKELMMTMANSVQAISSLKMSSTDKMVLESNKILYKILKSPYNQYSPILEAAEIERIKLETFNYGEAVQDYVPFQLKDSSKMRYNLLSDSWVAEDGSSHNLPFGVHQIQEEIVAPIVQNLMNETRIERLKIYNHIKDQKISYLNKWHQDTEDFYGRNRAESADLVNLMRASLRDYIAAFNTLNSLKKTEESMSNSGGSLDATVVSAEDNSIEVVAAFELQSKEFQDVQMDFENYMEHLKEDIDYKAEKFEHIDYYDALLRDGNSKDIAVATSEIHELDDRRKSLINVNPLFAKNSEIPPVPSIESLTHEHFMLNLPALAKNSLNELENEMMSVVNESIKDEQQNIDLIEVGKDSESSNIVENTVLENEVENKNISTIDTDSFGEDSVETEEDNLDNSVDAENNDSNKDEDSDEDDLFDDEDENEPIIDGPIDGGLNIPEIDVTESNISKIKEIGGETTNEISNVLNSLSKDEKDFLIDQAVEEGKDLAKEELASAVPLPPEMTNKAVDFLANKGKGFLKSKISNEEKVSDSLTEKTSLENSKPIEDKSNDKIGDLKSKFSGLLDKKSDIKKKFGF
jgi:hypothetical protein